MNRIPANLLTGFLGVGKTTAILDLLHDRSERWAVLVNEYGEVSIDGAILEGSGEPVSVREVGGGCICCATAPYLQVALHLLLTEAKPTRLLIETTGLGHPAALLDKLRAQYSDRLDVRATIGLVSPDDAANPALENNAIFQEQVEMADVLVLNRLDEARPGQVEAFESWAAEMFPPKLLIAATQRGRLEKGWLDLHPAAEHRQGARRYETTGPVPARGWVFSPEIVFDEAKLLELFAATAAKRIKGVFHLAEDWVVIQKARGQVRVSPTHYRHDNRVEVIGYADWTSFESGLESAKMA